MVAGVGVAPESPGEDLSCSNNTTWWGEHVAAVATHSRPFNSEFVTVFRDLSIIELSLLCKESNIDNNE